METGTFRHLWAWIICTFLVTACLHASTPDQPEQGSNNKEQLEFSFEDIWNKTFDYEVFGGRWIKNDIKYKNASGDIILWNPVTNVKEVLIDAALYKNLSIARYSFSEDMRYVLISYDYQKQWRSSFKAKYKILDRERNGLDQGIIDFPNSDDLKKKDLIYATWAPKGEALSFVYKNDLYYQPSPFSVPQQITQTGDDLYVYNGVPDWLYEEDVLGDRVAQYWSPDGQYLVFATFNDTNVPLIEYPIYGPSTDVYGKTQHIPYPKAGYKTETGKIGANTEVKLHLVVISDLSVHDIPVPQEFRDKDHYYLQVAWANVTFFLVTWSNRAQNHSIVSLCNAVSVTCYKHLETRYPGGWIRVPVPKLHFSEGGSFYTAVRSHNEGTSGSWRQVALIPTKVNAEDQIQFLTEGERDVFRVLSVDEAANRVYYESSQGHPKDTHIFSTGYKDTGQRDSYCITCDGECNYNRAKFSENNKYYIRQCRGSVIPFDALYKVDSSGQIDLVEMLENNADLEGAVKTRKLPTRKFLEIPVGGGYMAHAEVFFPPGFSEDKKYPLLIKTYGGPGSQEVLDYFFLLGSIQKWMAHLSSTLGVVVVSVDGRGAGGRGDRYLRELYRRMGTVEVEDQAYAARYFKAKPYIDDSKGVAIYGWSYGGEVSTQALATYPVFGCAIAVAPVISKRYYDTAYTERVMGFDLPSDNEAGYNATDLTQKVANITGKKYMLIHGTQDDNVHFMNTAQMVKALTDAEIQFNLQVYVDEPHAINARKSSRRHLFQAMTDFLRNDCWDMSEKPQSATVYSDGQSTMPQSLLLLFFMTIPLL